MRIGISGHQCAPAPVWESIEVTLRARLNGQERPVVGVSALAAGADQLFARLILAAGHDLEVVVPCDGYDSTFDDGGATFRSLLVRATKVRHLPFPEPSEEAFFAAGKAVVDGSDLVLAVWDGKAAKGLGGTADVVAYAKETHVAVEVIWPEGATR